MVVMAVGVAPAALCRNNAHRRREEDCPIDHPRAKFSVEIGCAVIDV